MTRNPLLDELRAIREKLLADAGGTLEALVHQIQENEQVSKHPRVSQDELLERPDASQGIGDRCERR